MTKPAKTRVLFCCLGNICRSPTAHGVFAAMVAARGLADVIQVDSCGTGGWHVGEPPDRRAAAESDIQAMDHSILADIRAISPRGFSGHLGLFLDFAEGASEREVPDPYYGGDAGFPHVLDLVEAASEGLLREICGAAAR